jgi:hypothetical protein
MTRLPRSPGSTLVFRLNQETVHDFILLFMPPCGPHLRWPPGPSNEAYLSSPHLEASPAATFRACCSPAPIPFKPQPAPAILSQESVHTTLSITHHTRKRPSTGSRTTHGPQMANWRSGACRWSSHASRACLALLRHRRSCHPSCVSSCGGLRREGQGHRRGGL